MKALLIGFAAVGTLAMGLSAQGSTGTVRVQDLTLVSEKGAAVQHQVGGDEANLTHYRGYRPGFRGYGRPGYRPGYRPGFRGYYGRPGYRPGFRWYGRWMAPQNNAATQTLPSPSVQLEK